MKKLLGLAILSSLLMANSNASTIDNEMRANWFSAVHNEEMDQIRSIAEAFPEAVNLKDNCQATALHYAAAGGYIEMAKILLSSPLIDIDSQDMDGVTALHMAVLNRHVDLANLLKTSGANADIMDNIGNTAQDMDGTLMFRRLLRR